ncbi:MAG: DUF2877 domain-containing protein [Elusimicrobiota bacterium]
MLFAKNKPAQKIKLLSYSSDIKNGAYELHSKFLKAANYKKGREIISFVIREIGDGPGNIVVNSLPDFDTIRISKNKIYSVKEKFELPKKKYFPKIENKVFLPRYSINRLIKYTLKNSPALSMSFVFDEKREKFFNSPFLKKMLFRMKKGADFLKKDKVDSAVKILCGLGVGLTPSGDDFLSGAALAYYVLGKQKKAKKILCLSHTDNLISYNNIRNSSQGKCSAGVKDIIKKTSKNKYCRKSLKKVLNTGSTSGADFLSGFLFTLSNCL